MKKLVFVCLLFCLKSQPAGAQLSAAERAATVDSLVKKLNAQYVFPEQATKIAAYLKKQWAQKRYDTITTGLAFAGQLTQDLQAISNDHHLRVAYSPDILKFTNDEPTTVPESERAQYAQALRQENYGIRKLDVLKGNIGYVDFKWFCGPEFAGDTYIALMNYLAHTDALIIDLRTSQGSMSPDAIPLLCSYFFDKPVHLNDLYWRKGNVTNQYWTYAYVPGKKYLGKPVYVLTSGSTFSGAEELAYDLKNLGRATLVGETTGGGANGGGDVRLTDHFSVFLPVGRAINPITQTNWEGSGVTPDSAMPANRALYAAQLMALRAVKAATADVQWNGFLQATIAELEKTAPVYKTVRFELKGFEKAQKVYVAGSFNSWSPRATAMKRVDGNWVATAETEPGKVTYKFVVDGRWLTDPANPEIETDGENQNSIINIK